MKRDPLSIISLLIQTLETFNENQEHNFNEISSRSNLHWETVKKYLLLIKHVQNLSPIIELGENKIRIIKKLSNENLNPANKLLLTLFYSKAFSENSAIDLLEKDDLVLKDSINIGLIQETATQKFYLTDSGKRTTFKIYRQISDTIYQDYLKLHSNLPIENIKSGQNLNEELKNQIGNLEFQLTNRIKALEFRLEKIINLRIIPPEPCEKLNKPQLNEFDNAGSSLNPKVHEKNMEMFG